MTSGDGQEVWSGRHRFGLDADFFLRFTTRKYGYHNLAIGTFGVAQGYAALCRDVTSADACDLAHTEDGEHDKLEGDELGLKPDPRRHECKHIGCVPNRGKGSVRIPPAYSSGRCLVNGSSGGGNDGGFFFEKPHNA